MRRFFGRFREPLLQFGKVLTATQLLIDNVLYGLPGQIYVGSPAGKKAVDVASKDSVQDLKNKIEEIAGELCWLPCVVAVG